jgi:hypothetical protein
MARRSRLETVGEGVQATTAFAVDTVRDAARDIIKRADKAITKVENARMRKNPYAIKYGKRQSRDVFEDRGEAERLVKTARKQGHDVDIIDLGTRNGRRETLVVEKAQAPANARRTPKAAKRKTVAKRARPMSKLEALSSFFKRNPITHRSPSPGEYYFVVPGHHGYFVSRSLAEIQSAAAHVADQTGKRIAVSREELGGRYSPSYREKHFGVKPRRMRANPSVEHTRLRTMSWANVKRVANDLNKEFGQAGAIRHADQLSRGFANTDAGMSEFWRQVGMYARTL